ncbi:MAG: L-seryl-tRNA(Sec) selenium transferase [Acidimicrobiia bacterium]|nr:L-seryl-tRNA(Sec) selenium transferase [Acidimicrobiia bacterium]
MELRDLPSVTDLATAMGDDVPGPLRMEIARGALSSARDTLLADRTAEVDPVREARERATALAAHRPRNLINATGVLLHTNLGRAPLASEAADAQRAAAVGYGNLEFDVTTGRRGGRGAYLGELLRTVTGAEAGFAVNNNAGALLLSLAALAGGRRAVVSRGELIEIGGSFRLPDLMAASGTTLVEVGTTNRTRLADYAATVHDAALILKVHPSNYRVEGFAEEATYAELATLSHEANVPFVADVGSGLLDARTPWLEGPPPAWTRGEPAVRQTLESGADVVLFSGDKLLGGPQAGIAVGSASLIDQMRRHPLARALRADGPTVAALGATLEMYATGRGSEVPFWAMASQSYEVLEKRSSVVVEAVGSVTSIIADASIPGAGSVPGEKVPSPVVRISADEEELWQELLSLGLVARRTNGAVLVDLRTVDPHDDDKLIEALISACR